MIDEQRLQIAADYVEEKLVGEGSGHDWWHIVRVRNMAARIAQAEGGNHFICQMAALLHDLADEKVAGSEAAGLREVKNLLETLELSKEQVAEIMEIVSGISYKGGHNHRVLSLEGQIVQDADRLDALGAIGIARTMAYSGNKNRIIHDPTLPIREQMSLEEYRAQKGSAITHFYEKLLKLKDLMNTQTARKIAQGRHEFLEIYLKQFYAEWDGER